MSKVSHVKGVASSGGPRLFIATPTYTGKLDTSYVHSLMYSLRRFADLGISVDHYVMGFNCHVDDGRNGILRDFMLTDCTDLIFIDADVSWEPEALVRLAQHDRDVVAGVYPKRSPDDESYPVHVLPGTSLNAEPDGLVEVVGAPTGFMKIKRHVIEKFFEANKHRQFIGMGGDPEKPHTIVFERTYTEGHRWSGDYNFCREWRKMGGKIFVDPEMALSHTGEMEFSGTLGDYWRKKHGVESAQLDAKFEQAIVALRRGDPSPSDFLALWQKWNNPYSAGVDLLATCYDIAKEMRGPILETGSGLSTLVMALANPNVTIHVLEHDAVWASALKQTCAKYGVINVEMHYAPLTDYFGEGRWYNVNTLPCVPFSLVLCDGPPRAISKRSLLFDKLGHQIVHSIVLMDDADDEAALEPIEKWSASRGGGVRVYGAGRKFALSYEDKLEASA